MKKKLLLLILLVSSSIFAQGPYQPTQFNTVCDDNNDGYATFLMQEIAWEIMGNTPNIVVTHHLTQIDAANGTNAIVGDYTNISNPQTIYARYFNTVTSVYQVVIYNLTVNPTPIATPFTLTECLNNGTTVATFDLYSASQIIWNQNQSNPNTESIIFYESQENAMIGTNQLPSVFTAYLNPQTVYYRVENIQTGCFAISTLTLVSENCTNPNCPAPTNLMVSSITNNSAVLGWVDSGTATEWEVKASLNGVSFLPPTIVTVNPFVLTNLQCGGTITFEVRAVCSTTELSSWNAITFQTLDCLQIGQPSFLTSCIVNGSACFDLTSNDALILANLNPSEYTVSYHSTTSGAASNTDLISDPSNYCITDANQTIYVRVEEIANPTNYEITYFVINAQSYILDIATNIAVLNECDDDNNGQVIFDLTEAELNMNAPSIVSYYFTIADAENELNPIANPTAYSVGLQPVSSFLYARATNSEGTCDTVYRINLKAFALCNNAYVCSEANSLCGSLGQPFLNTFQGINAEAGNNYSCLGSQPNPTWFYLPVSSAGNLDFFIEQSSDINFTSANLDVDFICYGPFTSPTEGCGAQLSSIIDCSYSAASVETVNIPNALPGQYYLIMVTNFSNQAGYIRITELAGTNQGALDCSGLNLNAFLDVNANGTQDIGEVNFPLGTFTYQLNNNGTDIDVTAPFGEYNIYDDNATNSYDLSYTVLPEYASYYNVTTASYANVSVVIGGGLQVYNFPVTITQPYTDLAAYIVPTQQPRPGFTYKNKVVYANLGNQTVANGTVTFTKDANVVITANTQTGTVANTTGFTYDYANLLPYEIRTMDVTMQVPTIPSVQLGQLLTNSVSITPTVGDVVPLNNSNTSTQIIIGSYDPNDKMESRGGQILHSSFTSEDYLYYTIRFENTGTASAVNVRIEDVLDSKLDESSIRMLEASHAYTLEREDSQLTWYFDNIQLPTTTANAVASKGFVYFKIKPKPGYAVGDIIPNTANIYFDFNPAIVTNTFNSEFVAALAVETFAENNVQMYPNPASNQVTISLSNTAEILSSIRITDVLGKQIIAINKIDQVSKNIDVSSLKNGVYFIEIETQNKKITKQKLVIKN